MGDGAAEEPREPPDADDVRAVIEDLDLGEHDVWVHYLAMFGTCGFTQFVDALDGRGQIPAAELVKVVAAVNDLCIGRGVGPRLHG